MKGFTVQQWIGLAAAVCGATDTALIGYAQQVYIPAYVLVAGGLITTALAAANVFLTGVQQMVASATRKIGSARVASHAAKVEHNG